MSLKDTVDTELAIPRKDVKKAIITKFPAANRLPLPADSVLVCIDSFAMTANNITYALLGQSYQYFDFFPATAGEWGSSKDLSLLPVWAMATVVSSSHKGIKVGQRIYGYLPSSRYTVLTVSLLAPWGFAVSRPQLPADRAVYHQYFFTQSDPYAVAPQLEDFMLVFRPLFFTSFFVEDYLSAKGYTGGGGSSSDSGRQSAVIISSASSKTAFSLAFMLQLHVNKRTEVPKGGDSKASVRVIGLTSKSNVEYVKGLQLYDDVVLYDALETAVTPSNFSSVVFVDIAGNATVQQRVVQHCAGPIKLCLSVGMTHVESSGSLKKAQTKSNVPSEVFFAPSWIKLRQEQLGAALPKRIVAAWTQCMKRADAWLRIKRFAGAADVLALYQQMLKGDTRPDEAYICTLHDSFASSSAHNHAIPSRL